MLSQGKSIFTKSSAGDIEAKRLIPSSELLNDTDIVLHAETERCYITAKCHRQKLFTDTDLAVEEGKNETESEEHVESE